MEAFSPRSSWQQKIVQYVLKLFDTVQMSTMNNSENVRRWYCDGGGGWFSSLSSALDCLWAPPVPSPCSFKVLDGAMPCVCLGGVYSDRQLKTTRLPSSLVSGRVITFETELVAVNKLRVTVEVCEKVITFDWNLPSRATSQAAAMNLGGLGGLAGLVSSSASEKVSMYFFTRLSHPGVSVTVH